MRKIQVSIDIKKMLNLICNQEKGNYNLSATRFHTHQTCIKSENFIKSFGEEENLKKLLLLARVYIKMWRLDEVLHMYLRGLGQEG